MRLQQMAARLAVIAALALPLDAWAQTPSASPRGRVSYSAAGGPSGYVDLSQDSQSGAGFYPLPQPYRAAARRQRAVQYAGERSAIGTAIASEAIGYDYDEGYAFGHGHGVFNPIDGVGTPFFAGYYD